MIEVFDVIKQMKKDKFISEFKRLKGFNYTYALAINKDINITAALYYMATKILGEEYGIRVPFPFKKPLQLKTNKYYIVLLNNDCNKTISVTIQTVADSVTINKNTKSLYVFDTMEEVKDMCKEIDT